MISTQPRDMHYTTLSFHLKYLRSLLSCSLRLPALLLSSPVYFLSSWFLVVVLVSCSCCWLVVLSILYKPRLIREEGTLIEKKCLHKSGWWDIFLVSDWCQAAQCKQCHPGQAVLCYVRKEAKHIMMGKPIVFPSSGPPWPLLQFYPDLHWWQIVSWNKSFLFQISFLVMLCLSQ